MWELIISSLYLLLPGYVANMAPVIARRCKFLPSLDWAIDRGIRLANQPLLGPHKTIRGIVVGLAAGVLVALLQSFLMERGGFWRRITLFPFWERSALLWGLLLGGGALTGDIVESFIKRRLGIPPGHRWIPWDQLDMIIGALLFGALYYRFSLPTVLIVLILTPILGLVVNTGSYILRIKEKW